MDKQGKDAITIPFMYILYLVLTVVILGTLVVNVEDRISGDELINFYTVNTLSSSYGLVNVGSGEGNLQYTSDESYNLKIEGTSISVVKEGSGVVGNSYLIKNGFLEHRDIDIFVNTTVNITKEKEVVKVE